MDLGEVMLALGRLDEASDHYTQGLSFNLKIGRQDYIARATYGLARIDEQRKKFPIALERARSAHVVFDRLGMETEAAEARGLIARLEDTLAARKKGKSRNS